ncbi:hypothetical protein HCJ58_11880 [Listeria sp. FSL L7-1509]|uniref:Uncharacterized protein n=1 Tax=Listeria immobilis TaxID=2713502 RepID=A0ABR6SYQ4_9LIST|nr:hypothetical protein [Listeria immobilis]MBC1483366.1 hypothetical protein [Listeria immobilis]MBC1507653.1 hypothetical protein [Listeria immobilis]MBC1510518.1 hypothetical protein [Listeria immobilis]MBC6303651.1 hypothetical protein [Listeria immobilis]MBC6312970.1 hypothetical protein [Listeria immobilis]
MVENINSSESLNKKYFISLAKTRGSVGALRIQLIALLVLSIIGLIPGIEIHSWYNNIASTILYGMLKFYVVYAIVLNIYFFLIPKKIVYKHQVFNSILLFFTLLIELVILVALSFMISNSKSTGYKSNIADFNATYSMIFLVLIGTVALLTICYNVFWIRKNIRKGFSEQRKVANYLAFSKVFNFNSAWIIFGVVSITGVFFTNFLFILGLLLALVFVLAFTRLLIEIGYLTYLKSVNRDYWEEYKDQKPFSFNGRLRSILRKKYVYVLIGIAIIVGMVKIDEKYALSKTIKNIFGFIVIVILIGFMIILIQWIIKKIKNKHVGRKK